MEGTLLPIPPEPFGPFEAFVAVELVVVLRQLEPLEHLREGRARYYECKVSKPQNCKQVQAAVYEGRHVPLSCIRHGLPS